MLGRLEQKKKKKVKLRYNTVRDEKDPPNTRSYSYSCQMLGEHTRTTEKAETK